MFVGILFWMPHCRRMFIERSNVTFRRSERTRRTSHVQTHLRGTDISMGKERYRSLFLPFFSGHRQRTGIGNGECFAVHMVAGFDGFFWCRT